MKLVKTKEDLQRLALRRGASASVGSSKFNSTADKVDAVVTTTQVPEKAPIVIQEQPISVSHEDLGPAIKDLIGAVGAHAEASSEIARSNAAVISELQKAISEISGREPAAAAQEHIEPKKWKLLVNRDVRGILQSIDVIQTN